MAPDGKGSHAVDCTRGELWVDNSDVRLRVEVTGEGPVVLCVSGFPELPSSWRHQVAHLSAQGFRVAALEVRGYGASSAPAEPERYTLKELAGDVAAAAAALSDEPVVLVGHDWGAPIVWHSAIRHPDRVRAVAGLSVPHTPPAPISLLDVLEAVYPGRFHYMLAFQDPGRIEAELAEDLRGGLKRLYYAASGLTPEGTFMPEAPRDARWLELLPAPPAGPLAFLDDAELDHCAETFARSGMVGPLNRYRAMGLDVAAQADIVGAFVEQPSCFIAGERDMVRHLIPGHDSYAATGAACRDFRGATFIPGVGHWVQQEAPDQVNAALEEFLLGL